jgi:glycosyltransferase involved in cell wall biosynthesis
LQLGVSVLPTFYRSDYCGLEKLSFLSRIVSIATSPMEYFYPAVRLQSAMNPRLQKANPDVIFIFWNPEGLAATYRFHDIPKFAYYGVPDHMPGLARLEQPRWFYPSLGSIQLRKMKLALRGLEKYHFRLMNDCDIAANICADHSVYYAIKGHKRSLYVPNLWPLPSENGLQNPSRAEQPNAKLKIIGSIGTVHTTGNTYGLHCIAQEIVPRLDTVLGSDRYELHILGAGELPRGLRALLDRPAIKIRGWVEDIDEEIIGSDLFLVTNNCGPYKGSYTRFLHAWSLGRCCVAHRYAAKANPEMVHGENILLGDTADELVQLIVQAAVDPELRQRIGLGGWRTLRSHFSPEIVAERLLKEMELLVQQRTHV